MYSVKPSLLDVSESVPLLLLGGGSDQAFQALEDDAIPLHWDGADGVGVSHAGYALELADSEKVPKSCWFCPSR